MTKATQTEILSQIIELLTPLSSEERHRIVKASLTFLGETPTSGAGMRGDGDDTQDEELVLPSRASTWRKQNGVTTEQLQHVFTISDGSAEVIASEIPGSSNKERTINAYVLAGLAKYLATGDLKFDDKSARSVCSDSGCFDPTNHSTYLKSKGNLFTGTKDSGWALTTPGLKLAADLVKRLAQ